MRDNSTSVAKAIAIILMVIGHAGCPELLHNLIYQFHIPLFFFFSGYCFKDRHLSDFRTYAKRKVTGIYLPFIKYALIFLALHNVFFHLNIYNDSYGYNGVASSLYTGSDYMRKTFKILTAMSHEERLLGGYWFLKILFCTSFVGYAFYRFLKNWKAKVAGVVVLFAITVFLAKSDSLSNFYNSVYLTTFATIFFVAGKTFATSRVINEINTRRMGWTTLLCTAILVTLTIAFPAGFTSPDMKAVYIVGALSGIIMTKNISTYLLKFPKISRILVYIGDNTMSVLTWHFLCFVAVSLAIIRIHGLPVKAIASFPVIAEYASKGWWIVYSIFGTAIPILLTAGTGYAKQYILERIPIRQNGTN